MDEESEDSAGMVVDAEEDGRAQRVRPHSTRPEQDQKGKRAVHQQW